MNSFDKFRLATRFSAALLTCALIGHALAQLPTVGWPSAFGNGANTSSSSQYGATPNVRWRVPFTGTNSPIIGPDGTIYISHFHLATDSDLLALNPADGSINWTAAHLGSYGRPAIDANGFIYTNQLANNTNWYGYLRAVDLSTQKLVWSIPVPSTTYPLNVNFDQSLLLTSEGGPSPSYSVQAINHKTGDVIWSTPADNFSVETCAIGPRGTIYVNQLASKEFDAVDSRTGNIKWSYRVGPIPTYNQWISNPMASPDGNVYQCFDDANFQAWIVCLDSTSGIAKWTCQLPGEVGYVERISNTAIGPDGTVYVGYEGGSLVGVAAIDPATGIIKWTRPANGPPFFVCAGDGTLYEELPGSLNDGISAELLAINGKDGSLLWSYTFPFSGIGDGGDDHSPTMAIGVDGSLILVAPNYIYCFESVHVVSLAVNPATVQGGTSATGTVTVNMAAPAGGFAVQLSPNTGIAAAPATVTIPAGATTAMFQVTTEPVDVSASITLTAMPGVNQTATLTVVPANLAGLSLSPAAVGGGSASTGTVTLSGPAGPAGSVVTLKSDSASATVPATVTVASGKTSASFAASTKGVDTQTTANITAILGSASFTQGLTISPASLASLTLAPASVQGGKTSTGTVTLSGIAGPSGTAVALKTSNANAATVPASVTVPAGKSTATFTVTTVPVASDTTLQVSGTLNSVTQSARLTVTAPTLVSLVLNPTSVPAGTTSTGTVTVSGPAPTAGLPVSLSSSSTSASVPGTVTVAGGATSAAFTVSTTGVDATTTATITASLAGLKQTATLTVDASTLSGVSLNPTTVLGGGPSTGTVNLSGPAGPSGAVVTLTSSSQSAKVPVSVKIPFGNTSATFTVTTTGVNTLTSAVVAASFGGTSAQANLSITPVQISTLSVSPTSVQGGTSATGTVTLNGPAAVGGTTVSLSSSNGSAGVHASITIPTGQASGTFSIQTATVSSATSATITASANGSSATASLTVTAPILTGLTLSPATIAGIGTSTGTVTLSGPASSGGAAVSLRSAVPSVAVPASVTIPAGSTSSTFTVSASAVTSQTTAAISASFGSVTKSVNLTLLPLTLSGVSVSPNRIQGGASGVGTVSLNGNAPSGGVTVLLKSSLAGVKVPASVKIPSGQSSASFTVTTIGTASEKSSTITATWGSTSVTTTVTLLPPTLTAVTLSPASVTGGTSSTGTVTLSGAAPTGGISLKLTSRSAAATVPASITVPAGKTSATFMVKTTAVASDTGTSISASLNGTSQSATLKILAPVLSSLVLKPASVIGGSSSTATVTLTGPAPKGGLTLTLGSSSASATVPATLVLASGKANGTFTVKTKKVTSQTTASISASLSSAKVSANLTIK